jgi:hypothetical protein
LKSNRARGFERGERVAYADGDGTLRMGHGTHVITLHPGKERARNGLSPAGVGKGCGLAGEPTTATRDDCHGAAARRVSECGTQSLKGCEKPHASLAPMCPVDLRFLANREA